MRDFFGGGLGVGLFGFLRAFLSHRKKFMVKFQRLGACLKEAFINIRFLSPDIHNISSVIGQPDGRADGVVHNSKRLPRRSAFGIGPRGPATDSRRSRTVKLSGGVTRLATTTHFAEKIEVKKPTATVALSSSSKMQAHDGRPT